MSIASDADQNPDLKFGPCCGCGRDDVPATKIVLLPFKNQVPGHGWGCDICDLPPDGACAVLCGECAEGCQRGTVGLRFACRGYPAYDGRMAIGELTVPHRHDPNVDHDA